MSVFSDSFASSSSSLSSERKDALVKQEAKEEKLVIMKEEPLKRKIKLIVKKPVEMDPAIANELDVLRHQLMVKDVQCRLIKENLQNITKELDAKKRDLSILEYKYDCLISERESAKKVNASAEDSRTKVKLKERIEELEEQLDCALNQANSWHELATTETTKRLRLHWRLGAKTEELEECRLRAQLLEVGAKKKLERRADLFLDIASVRDKLNQLAAEMGDKVMTVLKSHEEHRRCLPEGVIPREVSPDVLPKVSSKREVRSPHSSKERKRSRSRRREPKEVRRNDGHLRRQRLFAGYNPVLLSPIQQPKFGRLVKTTTSSQPRRKLATKPSSNSSK